MWFRNEFSSLAEVSLYLVSVNWRAHRFWWVHLFLWSQDCDWMVDWMTGVLRFYFLYRGAASPGLMRPGHKADNSPASAAKVRYVWSDTTIPPYAFMYLPSAGLYQGTGTDLTLLFWNTTTDRHARSIFLKHKLCGSEVQTRHERVLLRCQLRLFKSF